MIYYELIETYDDLLTMLAKMSPEQRKQPIQAIVMCNTENVVVECLPAIAIGEVDCMDIERVRSSVDNKYRGRDIVLTFGANPFGEDGRIGVQRGEDGKQEVLYGPDGPTNPQDQERPIPF